MMIPKCTGFDAERVTIGRKIGVQIRSIGARSMKVPSTSSSTLIKQQQGVFVVRHGQKELPPPCAGTCISAIM